VNKVAAFWDASALVPLCVPEATSLQAQSLLKKHPPVVWWASVVEVHNAVSRLQRLKQIDDSDRRAAIARLKLLSRSWKEILPDDPLRELATHLLDIYSLRAAAGMQLASALTWCQQQPAKRHLICADQRLSEAAQSAGFSVLRLSRSSL
jgi:predicted nucleic acid-binding protein